MGDIFFHPLHSRIQSESTSKMVFSTRSLQSQNYHRINCRFRFSWQILLFSGFYASALREMSSGSCRKTSFHTILSNSQSVIKLYVYQRVPWDSLLCNERKSMTLCSPPSRSSLRQIFQSWGCAAEQTCRAVISVYL